MKTYQDVQKIIAALRTIDAFSSDDVIWYLDQLSDNEIKCSIICSDVFWWGTADAENIENDDIELLLKCYSDIKDIDVKRTYAYDHFLGMLYCCRKRKMRPQGAVYKNMPAEIWHLFDACGPVRDIGFGNPKRHPSE